jgi:Fe2+ transport system protein FeoA
MFGRSKRIRRTTGRYGSMTLAYAVPGKKYRIIGIAGGCRLSGRLYAMGVMPNEIFTVYTYSRGGPMCITLKGTKYAIGRGMTERIFIEEA